MANKSIAIAGLPESGKTTYVAALWHLLSSVTKSTELTFDGLEGIDAKYLNAIAKQWRDGLTQQRSIDRKGPFITIKLKDQNGERLSLKLPDLSGETFRDMWELRDFPEDITESFRECDGMLFFINANKILDAQLTTEANAIAEAMGGKAPKGKYEAWKPEFAPTQVKVVDLLQLFRNAPISVGVQKIAIVLSAWDKADPGRTPNQYLQEKMPLVHQYLLTGADDWNWRVYGVSAQGGDYEKENKQLSAKQARTLKKLRELDDSAERITVVQDGKPQSNDLTSPVAWLIA